jgi:hypothetical protein
MSKARETVETLRTVLVDGDVTNANFTGADLEVGKGGTGASTAGAARTALGLAIGTDVLAPDGNGSALTGVDSLPSQTSQSGKFLTTNGSAASWGEAGGAWNLLSTVTASSSSTVDIETTFDSTYDRYVILVDGMVGSADAENLIMLLKIGGSYLTTSTYRSHRQELQSGSTSYSAIVTTNEGTGDQIIARPLGNVGGEVSNVELEIFNPSSTTLQKLYTFKGAAVYYTGASLMFDGVGLNTNTAALTGVRFKMSVGTIASGAFRLYGVSK